MLIYNTLTNKKEDLILNANKKLKLFVCGPTVYDKTHIGHARTYVFFDIVKRYLAYLGYNVIYLQNITDVHDNITQRACRENLKPLKIARYYEKDYHATMKKIGVTSVDKYARATDYIPEIIDQIKILINKNHAYVILKDGIYFDLKSFPEYGKLSKRTTKQAEDAVSRVDESISKRNKGDFCLWKFYSGDKSEPFWETELGEGRPGWHIEDTAITDKYFGPQYDIHGGGIDLKFPHHENEIAQQESASGIKPFVKIWMHTGSLLVSGKKMSKSLGNFITVDDFLEKYSPQILRMIVLGYHYRSPIDYSDEVANQANRKWDDLLQFLSKLILVNKHKRTKQSRINSDEVNKKLANTESLFHAAMQDDFNTPKALATLHILINELQSIIYSFNKKESKAVGIFIKKELEILGFMTKLPKIPSKIQKIAQKRELLRSNKQFVQADDLRKEIDALGYTVEDTPLGSFIWPKK